MNQDNQSKQPVQPATPPKRPNETGTISVRGHLRIFDPQSQNTLVEKQG